MVTVAMERKGRLPVSQQQVTHRLVTVVPCLPATLRDSEVPHFFRERHVLTGYRPLHQDWRYYLLSLFRRHNETVNVWTHLLGALLVLVWFRELAEVVDFAGDAHSWPLLILLLSSFCYMSFSAVAHLLAPRSELTHYALFFLDYVGVALYQYGSAAVHFHYAVPDDWPHWLLGPFMPVAALLCCFSCFGCCFGKYCSHSSPSSIRKLGQVLPSALAYAWDTSPVFWRLWGCLPACEQDPAALFHAGQVGFFLASALFFTLLLPERWLAGRCDFLGQGHQLFHTLLVLCTLCQLQASHLDYRGRRMLYLRLHGDGEPAFLVCLFVAVALVCTSVAIGMTSKVSHLLRSRDGKHE
ncbi:progestin and adipoQ receptor family member VII, a [Paramormyrops kingsleyae]|uniref:progestin and adipoQ receptor family member VII, a n=1 Tax=Paramormyrops kingsleyae TaxID=1676925 RepID=UPI003B96A91D